MLCPVQGRQTTTNIIIIQIKYKIKITKDFKNASALDPLPHDQIQNPLRPETQL
jgi:hypothetical protein